MLTKLINNINAMATSRTDALKYLQRTSRSLTEHIIKRCVCSDHNYYNHWEIEIESMLLSWNGITLKTKRSRLTYNEYIKNIDLWCSNPETFQKTLNSLIKQQRLSKTELYTYNKNKAYQAIRTLLETVIKDVADNKFKAFSTYTYNIPQPDNLI